MNSMKKLIASLFLTAVLAVAGTATDINKVAAQNNPWIIFAQRIGEEAICSAAIVPGMAYNTPRPTTQDHRFALYLRCEAKGGADEFTPNSCCDHLTPGDANNIGVCPDRPVNVIVPMLDPTL
jgi:hypothetical protein